MSYLKIDNKVISTPLLDIVKDIQSILKNGKLKTIRILNNNIRVTCPHHNKGLEQIAASDIYIGEDTDIVEYGFFKCFVCNEQGPFYHFVAECFDEDDEFAKEWLIDNYADGLIEYELDLPEIDINESTSNILLDENILKTFEDYHPYMTKRKLSKDVISKFEIKYDPKTKCIVFPVRDQFGRLVMLTRRSVENKNFIIDKAKAKPVYLLNYIKENNLNTVLVVESQINALTCHSYNLPAIGLFGTGSSYQMEILNKSPIRYYILCFDGDEAGERGIQKFLKNIRKDVIVDIVRMPKNKDVNDLTKEEFLTILRNNFIDVNELFKNYPKNNF